MARDAQSAGAADGAVPMDIDSGTRGLAQSRHHPLSGLGSVNVETVSPEAHAVRERVPQHLQATSRLRYSCPLGATSSAGGRVESLPKHAKRRSDARRERDQRATALRAQQQHYYDRKPGWTSQSKRLSKRPYELPRRVPEGGNLMGLHRCERRPRPWPNATYLVLA
ncbi:hypothetical protein E4U33_007906 [Claviceps sp. LM78 group G4]|nr:hypothetical protein E4U33_007906 [Claviceps sp. LM78 group G4]